MATNEILRFAETNTGTNLLTQAEYLADSQRIIGNQPGVARSALVNKALRQSSLIAAGLAEYISDNQAEDITDALTPQNIADYLQAAITGTLCVTPPQFDNSISLSTTAFVQRALGNSQAFASLTGNVTLTSADAGKCFSLGGTTNSVIATLPLASTCPSGTRFCFINVGINILTISRQGSDLIFPTGSGITSVALGVGDSLVVESSGALWVAVGGSGTLMYSSKFGASLTGNGFQKLPSGLILQWGVVNTDATVPGATVILPLAMPNALILAIAASAGGNNTSNVSGISNSSFQVTTYEGATAAPNAVINVPWIAIGR